MTPEGSASFSFLEITESFLGCKTLSSYFEVLQDWSRRLCGIPVLHVALIQNQAGSPPRRILFCTGQPAEPGQLAAAQPSATATCLCEQIDILPGVQCLVLANAPHGATFPPSARDQFQSLFHLARAILEHSPLMNCLKSVCQRICQSDNTGHLTTLGPEIFQLTRRECEVLQWIEAGKQDSEIALILKMSVRTVQTHVRALLRKLDCENRLQLITLHLSPVLLSTCE